MRAQCGDRDALEQLLRSVTPPLHRYVRRLVGAHAADDIAQDVLIAVSRKLRWLSEPRLFRAWVFRIASREAFRYLRKQKRQGPYAGDEEILQALPAAAAPADADLARELLESDALSPASRAVLVLHFQEGLTLPEVAAVLEIPLGTVKSRLAYGLDALRRRIAEKRSP